MCNISVIGGSKADKKYLGIAYETGRLLAKRKATVICGGLTGVMESVARGVREGGGICVGILPGYDLSQGNRYLTVAIPTGLGLARNFLVVRAGESVIAIDGSTGTRTEAYFALSEKKTVITIGTSGLEKLKDTDGNLIAVDTPEEAVEQAISEASSYRKRSINPSDFLTEL